MSPSEKLIFDLKGAGGNFTNASCQKKSALREKKPSPLLLGDLFALYLLKTLKIPPLYFNNSLKLKHLMC